MTLIRVDAKRGVSGSKTRISGLPGILLIGIVLSVAGRCAGQESAPATQDTNGIRSSLTVHGSGEVTAVPDHAIVRLGAQAQAKDASSAQAAVNTTLAAAIEKIKALGVRHNAIRTTAIHLFPLHSSSRPSRESETPEIVGYRASNTIQIELEDLELVGSVLDAGVAAGANRVEGVSFVLRNDRSQRLQALRRAVKEAEEKAMAMAKTLDVQIVGVDHVTEGGGAGIPPPVPFGREHTLAAAAPTPVEPGEVQVQASVTVRYRILSTPERRGGRLETNRYDAVAPQGQD